MKQTERLPEFAVTEWRGATIRVIIEHPKLNNSLSYQQIIDDRMLDNLSGLTPPKELRLLYDTNDINPSTAAFEFRLWQDRKAKADKIVEMISGQIAWALGRTIEEANGD